MQLNNGGSHFADEHLAEDEYHQDIDMECAHLQEEQDSEMNAYNKQKVTSTTKKEEPILKSKVLRWHMPIIGEVPMSK